METMQTDIQWKAVVFNQQIKKNRYPWVLEKLSRDSTEYSQNLTRPSTSLSNSRFSLCTENKSISTEHHTNRATQTQINSPKFQTLHENSWKSYSSLNDKYATSSPIGREKQLPGNYHQTSPVSVNSLRNSSSLRNSGNHPDSHPGFQSGSQSGSLREKSNVMKATYYLLDALEKSESAETALEHIGWRYGSRARDICRVVSASVTQDLTTGELSFAPKDPLSKVIHLSEVNEQSSPNSSGMDSYGISATLSRVLEEVVQVRKDIKEISKPQF